MDDSTVLDEVARRAPVSALILLISTTICGLGALFYVLVWTTAPLPRPEYLDETTYETVDSDGKPTELMKLPSWHQDYVTKKQKSLDEGKEEEVDVEPADIFVSVVVPAYNEEDRIKPMLEEAIAYLEENYSANSGSPASSTRKRTNAAPEPRDSSKGWEILVVSDGSKDDTRSVVLDVAKSAPAGCVRFNKLLQNRGKGGAITQGMKHVRGQYILFADADGASKFSDVSKLIKACQEAEDSRKRAIACGSRAHLVSTDAVVKRSFLRNILMHAFHLFIWLFTTAKTSRVKDTQCGFKLFSRATLPYIVPNMHTESWIFDVEMLLLAEWAGIPFVEVPVGWHEVKGSKLNVIWDSIGMAWGLAILRLSWGVGVYQDFDTPKKPVDLVERGSQMVPRDIVFNHRNIQFNMDKLPYADRRGPAEEVEKKAQ